MSGRGQATTPFTANPFAFILSVVAIGAVILYFAYAAADRIGLEVRTAAATVTGKQFNPGGKSYYTTIAGRRAWVQSQVTPETYALILGVGDERTAGVVSKQLYDTLQVSDSVQVKIRRTRITGRLEVVEVRQ